jgi:hypothetical protein
MQEKEELGWAPKIKIDYVRLFKSNQEQHQHENIMFWLLFADS